MIEGSMEGEPNDSAHHDAYAHGQDQWLASHSSGGDGQFAFHGDVDQSDVLTLRTAGRQVERRKDNLVRPPSGPQFRHFKKARTLSWLRCRGDVYQDGQEAGAKWQMANGKWQIGKTRNSGLSDETPLGFLGWRFATARGNANDR